MLYQEPPPIFGSLIFYQTIRCEEKQRCWVIEQLTAILKGQRINTRDTHESLLKAFNIVVSNAMINWNKMDPKKRITIQLFVGDHRWGLDIINEETLTMDNFNVEEGNIELEKDFQFLDEYMDEVYYSLNGRNHFMMIRSR